MWAVRGQREAGVWVAQLTCAQRRIIRLRLNKVSEARKEGMWAYEDY